MTVIVSIRWPGAGAARAGTGFDTGWVGADNLQRQCAPRQQSIGCDCARAQGAVAGSHQSARMGRMPASKMATSVVDTVKTSPIGTQSLRRHPWRVKEPPANSPGKAMLASCLRVE
jgi:hypothetical protein